MIDITFNDDESVLITDGTNNATLSGAMLVELATQIHTKFGVVEIPAGRSFGVMFTSEANERIGHFFCGAQTMQFVREDMVKIVVSRAEGAAVLTHAAQLAGLDAPLEAKPNKSSDCGNCGQSDWKPQ